jgi:AraC-like DNA-binding protein
MDALVIEILARGIAIGALTAVGAGLWRGGGQHVRIAGVFFVVTAIAYVINSSPQLLHAIGWLRPLVHFLAFGGVAMFWLFIVTLFEDRAVTPTTLAPWVVLTLVAFVGVVTTGVIQRGVWIAHNLIEAALAFHALYVIGRSWRGDLVEARRRLRGPFLTFVTLYVLTLSGFEIAEGLGFFQPWFRLLGGVSMAFYCGAGAIVFLQVRQEIFGAAQPQPAPPAGLDAGDRAILDRLEALMQGEAWRREGLTIGDLANEVGMPEHRLRRLINDHLGFRNFAAFVNARRIAAAKAILSDPAQARVSVAAIAFDLGFGSLGPFNRAFKEETGVTPTQYRRQQLSPNSENPG